LGPKACQLSKYLRRLPCVKKVIMKTKIYYYEVVM
jgi:hypothetical protein